MRHDGCERTSALPLLEVLDSRDLVIFDRGYSAVWFLGLMAVRGVGFLSRISANWKPEVIRTLGDGDCLVEITSVVPKECRSQLSGKRRTRLTLRMIEYRVGTTASVRLLTNLLDPSAVSALALAKEYRRRWECESAFDEIKNDLAATAKGRLDLVFRSKTSDGVYQEVFALFAVYNLVRRLMRDAAEQADVDPLHLSFTDTLFLLRHHEPARRGRQAAAALLRSRVLVDVATTLNRRPRRPRQCQRALCSTLVRFPVKDPSKSSLPFSPTPVLKKTG